MPSISVACDFKDEGTTVYMVFPTSGLTKLTEAFHDGARHNNKVILVLNRESKVLEVHTRTRFDIVNKEFKALTDTHSTTDAAD